MKKAGRILGLGVLVVGGWSTLPSGGIVLADEGAETPLIQRPSPRASGKSAKKGKRREQKETEGTEAPERFEGDTILKSPYVIDGQPLEVDPD